VGRIVSRTNAKGQTTQFGYDALGLPADGHRPQRRTVGYAYDNVGNRISMTDPTAKPRLCLRSLNRLIQMTEPLGNTTSYAYDALGPHHMRIPTGRRPTTPTTATTADAVTYWNATTVKFYYDENGNRCR